MYYQANQFDENIVPTIIQNIDINPVNYYPNVPESKILNLFTLCNFLNEEFNFFSPILKKKLPQNQVIYQPIYKCQ